MACDDVTVGFVELGIMGSRMAANLQKTSIGLCFEDSLVVNRVR
jgi:3-hydroxyisobutyrate dehydrogenase-like beta-hydroxyacid dehydrogenase